MTDIVGKRPLVRPRFLKWSLVAFALLLPFVIHSVWDYIEARRLRAFIDEIARKGEPVRPEIYHPLTGGAAESARYYRAAAALASGFGREMSVGAGPSNFGLRVATAEREGIWPDDLVSDLRATLDRYRDALTFGDRAASLPFEGFGSGGSSSDLASYLAGELFNVQRLSSLRTELLALDGNGDQALDSFYTATRLTRAIGGAFSVFSAQRGASNLQLVLERTRPLPGALERVGGALAELDHDDRLTRRLVNLRALVLQAASRLGVAPGLLRGSTRWEDVIARPWNAHVLNRQLEVFSRLLLAAQAPWPERIDRVVAVGLDPVGFAAPGSPARDVLDQETAGDAEQVATIRSARLVVAIERYRRDHAEQTPDRLQALVPSYLSDLPIDPFSGASLLMKKETGGYTVYSLGTNRRDDGGNLTRPPVYRRPKNPEDIGIRIQYR